MYLSLGWLSWPELLDPTFDPAAVRARVEALALATPSKPVALVDDIRIALVDDIGPWSLGFCNAVGSGGLVASWCCPAHTIPAGTAPDVVATRVLTALTEWRDTLLDLRATFAELTAATAGLAPEAAIRHAAAELLPWVLAHNPGDDAWYGSYALVLRWWRQSTGAGTPAEDTLIHRTLGGRFASWSAPDEATAAAVCEDLGLELTIADEAPPVDGLAAWTAQRAVAFGVAPPAITHVGDVDAHLRHLDRVDAARDPARAARLRDALHVLRRRVVSRGALDVDTLLAANTMLLGAPGALRTGPAFAHGGREVYPLPPDLRTTLAPWLSDAHDPRLPLPARAARLYLDLNFLHPFEDGNARTARLALDALAWREGATLRAVGPLFHLARSGTDGAGAQQLTWVLADLFQRAR